MSTGLLLSLFIMFFLTGCFLFFFTKNIKNTLTIMLLLIMSAVPFYYYWGDAKEYTAYVSEKTSSTEVKNFVQAYKNPQHLIAKMQDILKRTPNSFEGWYLLGRLYMSQNEFAQAFKSFTKAYNLQQNNIAVQEQIALALFYENHQRINAQVAIWLDQVLNQQPNDPIMWNIKALDAIQRHKPHEAVSAWQHILQQLPPDSQAAKDLLKAIAIVQTHENSSH